MYRVVAFLDDLELRRKIVAALSEAGCTVSVPKHRADAQGPDGWLQLICSQRPQFIVAQPKTAYVAMEDLTAALRQNDGFREVRVLLAVDDRSVDLVEPDWQVDDLLFPPYSPKEIAARLSLAMRRNGQPAAEDTLVAGPLRINIANYEVTVGGQQTDLTYKEYELLRFLVSHPGRVHTRNALLNQVWGYDYYGGTRTVDVHIRRLREKLGLEVSEHIETVRNVGYRFRK